MTATDEFTEIVDADIARVDLVGKGANGLRFLIAKASEQGDMPAEVAEVALAKATEGETVDAVVKDDLDVTEVLAEPEVEAPGSDAQPGSPAWEAVDAATAEKWTGILARAKNALSVLADREMQEAATDEPDAMDNVFDLDDASCAIDYAISVLAPYAVGEESDIMITEEEANALVKACTALSDLDALGVAEGFGPLVKAGRVLSAANEGKIRSAVDSLQQVLTSLPAAPEADVAKEEHVDDTAAETEVAKGDSPVDEHQTQEPTFTGVQDDIKGDPAAPEAPDNDVEGSGADDVDMSAPAGLHKAKGDPQVAVYDSTGNLVGVVDPTAITTLTDAKAPGSDPNLVPAASADVGTTAAAAPTAPAPAPATVGKSSEGTAERDDVVKALSEALEQARENDAVIADVLKGLSDRMSAWEQSPAPSRVLTNGALPPPHLLRGQAAPTNPDVEGARSALEKAGTAVERETIANDLQRAASEALARIHAAGRPQS